MQWVSSPEVFDTSCHRVGLEVEAQLKLISTCNRKHQSNSNRQIDDRMGSTESEARISSSNLVVTATLRISEKLTRISGFTL